MSTKLDWSSLEGLEKKAPQQTAPQQGESKLDWSSLEGIPDYENIYAPKEDLLRTSARYAVQPGIGALSLTAPGIIAGAWEALGSGEALSEMQDWEYGNREAELRQKFPSAPWPDKPVFDKEKYLEALSAASSTVPTAENIASFLEKNTGLPLEARTELQKNLRTLGRGARLRPGAIGQRITAGLMAAGTKSGLEALGLPEGLAEPIALGVSTTIPQDVFESASKGIDKVFKYKSANKRLLEMISDNPQATGELTGLAGTQLEAFNALNADEKLEFLANLTKKKLELESSIAEETAAIGEKLLTPAEETIGETGRSTILSGTEKQKVSSLSGRVTKRAEDIGLRPAKNNDPRLRPSSIETKTEDLLGRVHQYELGNKGVAGEALKKVVMDSDTAEYKIVNDLYEKSRALNENINSEHRKLAGQLLKRYQDLKKLPRPSSVQSNLMNSLENILNDLAVIKNGKIVKGSYKKINNQVLIDQIQSLRQTVDFDFEHGSPKGIFKPTISDIQESVYRAAKGDAAKALKEANNAYREWTTKYNNDYINPYRDTTNKSFEALMKSNLDPDKFRVVNNLVGEDKVGKNILGAMKREVIESKLKDFIKEPILVKTREFRKAMYDLESFLTPAEVASVEKGMNELVPERLQIRATPKKKIPIRSVQEELGKFEKAQEVAAKYSSKTLAVVRKLSNTPEGIGQLKTDLLKTDEGKEIFKKFAKQKIKSILMDGKIRGTPTGTQLYEILNNEKNYSLIEALTSKEEAVKALDIAQKLANREFTIKNVAKLVKLGGKYELIHMLLSKK